jgi:hypothetical protein
VIPPPILPHPPAKALAVPTTLEENIWVAQNWHGTNVAPKIPIKNLWKSHIEYLPPCQTVHSSAMNPIYLKAIKPPAVLTKPTIAVGMAPMKSKPAITFLGPRRSQSGPTIKRATGETENTSFSELRMWSRHTHLESLLPIVAATATTLEL